MGKVLHSNPSISQQPQQLPGVGDAVAAATKAVGVQPCSACQRRREALNKATPGWLRRALAACHRLLRRR